jgi:hypothetical protein
MIKAVIAFQRLLEISEEIRLTKAPGRDDEE